MIAACAWVGWGERAVARAAHLPAPLAGGAAVATADDSQSGREPTAWPADEDLAWASPGRVSEWGFDLFTPPVVYFDRSSGQFTVSPAETLPPRAAATAATRFGLTLLAVDRRSYPLQLVGYAGEPGRYWGIFQDESTGAGVVAQAGHVFADLGLELRALEVRREDTLVPDSMPLRETVAVAEVWDAAAGRLVRLSSAGWQWADAPVAQVRIDATGELHAVGPGDRLESAGASFEIHSVAALPPSLLVGKHHDDGTREEMTLRPEPPANPPPPVVDPFSAP